MTRIPDAFWVLAWIVVIVIALPLYPLMTSEYLPCPWCRTMNSIRRTRCGTCGRSLS